MNTSEYEIEEEDLVGTVSSNFIRFNCYAEAAGNENYQMIFPGGICIFFELQLDPISMLHVDFSIFKTYLDIYHRLTQVLMQALDYLVKINVFQKTWMDRLTAALKKRDQIWQSGKGIDSEETYKQ